MHAFLCHGTMNLLNLLLALICNLETTFSALKSEELNRLDTEERHCALYIGGQQGQLCHTNFDNQ